MAPAAVLNPAVRPSGACSACWKMIQSGCTVEKVLGHRQAIASLLSSQCKEGARVVQVLMSPTPKRSQPLRRRDTHLKRDHSPNRRLSGQNLMIVLHLLPSPFWVHCRRVCDRSRWFVRRSESPRNDLVVVGSLGEPAVGGSADQGESPIRARNYSPLIDR